MLVYLILISMGLVACSSRCTCNMAYWGCYLHFCYKCLLSTFSLSLICSHGRVQCTLPLSLQSSIQLIWLPLLEWVQSLFAYYSRLNNPAWTPALVFTLKCCPHFPCPRIQLDFGWWFFSPHLPYIDGYQVQTNLFVQIVQTLIWATGSTSKGHGGLGNFTINRPLLDLVIILLQIPLSLPCAPPGCWSGGLD